MSSKSLPAIRRDIIRVEPELVAAASKFPAAILADVAGRRGALGARIKALAPHMKVAGPAFTVEVRPGDNLMFHAAIAMAQPGDVIVVDGKADETMALCGTLMSTQAQKSGIAGFVVDAAVRDSEEICAGTFPVFAIGTNPNGPTKGLAGRINWSVTLAGVTVNPGDLVVGDADGVVIIPRENAADIISRAQGKVDAEKARMADMDRGNLKSLWLNDALIAAGVLEKGQTL